MICLAQSEVFSLLASYVTKKQKKQISGEFSMELRSLMWTLIWISFSR